MTFRPLLTVLLLILVGFSLASCVPHRTGTSRFPGDVSGTDSVEEIIKRKSKGGQTLRNEIVQYASTFIGTRYRYGGKSPKTGFDCSGFTAYVFKKFGYTLTFPSGAQYAQSRKISRKQLLPGDLVFFGNTATRRINHVAIYAGNNRIVHAPSSGKRVEFTSLSTKWYDRHYIGSGRILPD